MFTPAFPLGGASAVTVGGSTVINQHGEMNMDFIGLAAPFVTGTLDIMTSFTGDAAVGNAFVMIANTTVVFGSIGAYVVDGATNNPIDNIFFDGGGNSGVFANSSTYLSF